MARPSLNIDQQSLITSKLIKRYSGHTSSETSSAELAEHAAHLAIVLELARQGFLKNEPAGSVVESLAARLHQIRQTASPAVWSQLIPLAQRHAVMGFLIQDPFTRWSFEKPRGYSGDASLLDIYYKHPSANEIVASSTPLGQEIYAYTSDAASSVAGRERRDILTASVSSVIERKENAEIFAIACGHLRESEQCDAVHGKNLKRWVAMDQDPASVRIVEDNASDARISAFKGDVRGLIRRSYDIGQFDFVYASGLYDYLPNNIGIRLLQRALEFLKPGGEFLFANFSDEIMTDGYMETFMDWPLLLRSDADMWAIINAAVDHDRFESDVFYGSNRNIVYGRVTMRP